MDLILEFISRPTNVYIAGLASAVIFFLISIIHGYWNIGGKWGLKAAVPEENGKYIYYMTPMSIFGIMFVSFLAGLVMLGRVGVFDKLEPEFLYRWLPWASVVVFSLRAMGDFRYVGFFKKVKFTTFSYWDGLLVTPLCAANAVASLIVALSPFPPA